MPKQAWTIAGFLSLLVALALAGVSAWRRGQLLDQTQSELTALQAEARQAAAQLETARQQLADNQARVEELQREKDAAAKAQQSLEQQMRAALESKDVTISELQGKLTVSILDRILFDSGEAVLKPEGEKVLEKVAAVLAHFPKRQVHVIGHTDNVPIKPSAWDRYPSNWELSTARATAAVRFLSEKMGVDPRRLGAVGYGEFHPVADNSTPEGRAQNRRIALVVLSEEKAGSDTAPTAAPIPAVHTPANPPGTNAPPEAPPPGGTTNTNPPAAATNSVPDAPK